MRRLAPVLLPLIAATGLAGCDLLAVRTPQSAPPPAPVLTEPPERSAASFELERYYSRVQSSLLAQGLLRTDGGGIDTPFSAQMLTENFIRIALFEEYTETRGRLVSQQSASTLRRWEMPVRMSVRFGDTVSQDIRDQSRSEIARYTQRLTRATNHPVRFVSAGANFHIFVVNDGELRTLGPSLRAIIPTISDAAVRTVTELPRTSYCLVFASNPSSTGTYDKAVAVIRAEHPPLMRRSCIHEELAQGLGLANDSPMARPSVFNDDDEFGLLTRHDELLLQILYDRRLRAGMRETEARPIVRQIAEELIGGAS